jgi:hypothetical protein
MFINPSNDPPAVAEQRDAIIFLPGIGSTYADQTLDAVATRIARALRLNRAPGPGTYRMVAREEEVDGVQTKVCTISYVGRDAARPVIDVFALNYGEVITAPYRNAPILRRAFLAALTLLLCVPDFLLALVRPGKTFRQKIQFLLAMGILALLSLYVAMLLFAAVDGVRRVALQFVGGGAQPPAATRPVTKSEDPGWKTLWHNRAEIIVALAAAGLVLPWNFREGVSRAAVQYVCVLNYLRSGSGLAHAVGQLEGLLGTLDDDPKVQYRRAIVLAYSFGAVVALDTLFPASGHQTNACRHVKTLITVGNPFDLLRTFMGGYYKLRRPWPACRPTWLNVYSPIDVMASNFKDDGGSNREQGFKVTDPDGQEKDVLPDASVVFDAAGRTRLTTHDIIRFTGMSVHYTYWGRGPAVESNCFSPIVQWLYKDDPFLP